MGNKKEFVLNFVRFDESMNPIYEHNGLYFKDVSNHKSATNYIHQLKLFNWNTSIHDIKEFYSVENSDIVFKPRGMLKGKDK